MEGKQVIISIRAEQESPRRPRLTEAYELAVSKYKRKEL
jgi:hypothetical protein